MNEIIDEYRRLGYVCIPLQQGRKRAAIKWGRFCKEDPTDRDYDQWFGDDSRNVNAGIVLRNVVVVDVDDPAFVNVVEWYAGRTPMRCQTPRGGFHLWFRRRKGVAIANSVGIKGKPLDIRTDGSYVVVPPSTNTSGKPYQWVSSAVPADELPLFQVSWLRRKFSSKSTVETPLLDVDMRRARAYMAKIEGAVTGNSGHSKTFYAACKAAWLSGGDAEQAWQLLLEYNERCEPPWSEIELRHKLEDALKKHVD